VAGTAARRPVGGAGRAGSVRIAAHGDAEADASWDVAGLALAAAGLIAADAVDAAAARALVRSAASLRIGKLGHADARRAPVAGPRAGHAGAVRIAADGGTGAVAPSRVAGLALAGAALVAAVTVDAEPGSALVRRGAGLAEHRLGHARARRIAVVGGHAVGVRQ